MTLMRKAYKIVKTLQKARYKAVFAGGCVRDSLLGYTPHDYDIATDATPDQVESLFRTTKAVGKAFGVILVKVAGTDFEVATFRTDGRYTDGRRPDKVTFSTMWEDAERRDFTVNAMFYDPLQKRVYDFVNGQEDLKNKVLRFVGDPFERVDEDHLRLLRFVRFLLKLKFQPDQQSFMAVRASAWMIHDVAKERVKDELMKMLEARKPRQMVELLFKTGLMARILPEVCDLEGCLQNPKFHPEGDVLEHTIRVMENLVNEPPLLQLAGMLHDVGKPKTVADEDGAITNKGHDAAGAVMVEEIMTRLKFSNDEIEYVRNVVGDHMQHHFVRSMRKSTLKRYMALPYFDDLMKLNKADISAASNDFSALDYVEEKRKSWTPEEIKPVCLITGKDLIDLGFTPGPIFSTILNYVMENQLEGKIKTKEQALRIISKKWGK